MKLYLEYLDVRSNDYFGWLEIGVLFHTVATEQERPGYLLWAKVIYAFALRSLRESHRASTEYAVMHQCSELEQYTDMMNSIGHSAEAKIEDLDGTIFNEESEKKRFLSKVTESNII
jgi:hypothetical protein